MDKKDLEQIFEYYILRLNGLINRKLRDLKYDEQEDLIKVNGELSGNFYLFEDIRCLVPFETTINKGKEKSFTSYTMLDFWKEVLEE